MTRCIADARSWLAGTTTLALCKRCPLHESCAYKLQEAGIAIRSNLPPGLVIFASHEWLFLPLPDGVAPHIVIFAKPPRQLGVVEHVITFERMLQRPGSDPKSLLTY
ncbi:MAG: hypothetical protein ABJO05_17585 [Roseibium sp.]